MIDDSFLGKGIALSFDIDNKGGVRFASLQDSVKESMFIILSTKVGERVMRYGFGCKIHELMFALNTASTRTKAKMYVENALKRWEHRITIKDVTVEVVNRNSISIDVEYYINSTNIIDNLVYPFYLVESE